MTWSSYNARLCGANVWITAVSTCHCYGSRHQPAREVTTMPQNVERFDVAVIGGGAAGVAAACAARREGARTLLVERYGFLGGAATVAAVCAYCGFYTRGDAPQQVVAGIGESVLAQMRGMGLDTRPRQSPSTGNWVV